jgi:hypothetical protein
LLLLLLLLAPSSCSSARAVGIAAVLLRVRVRVVVLLLRVVVERRLERRRRRHLLVVVVLLLCRRAHHAARVRVRVGMRVGGVALVRVRAATAGLERVRLVHRGLKSKVRGSSVFLCSLSRIAIERERVRRQVKRMSWWCARVRAVIMCSFSGSWCSEGARGERSSSFQARPGGETRRRRSGEEARDETRFF